MRTLLSDVEDFHVACDLPVLAKPEFPGEDRIALRRSLVAEEYGELLFALDNRDLAGSADAIGDLIYVLVGMALEMGLPLDRVWDEIQAANMRKVDPETGKVRRRIDGKILKPDSWVGPDIAKALA